MATETATRAQLALTTDAFAHANNLAYTVPAATVSTAVIVVSNVHATTSANVDCVVDVLGAGTTFRYVAKNMAVPCGASIQLSPITMLATDKLRIRASASSSLEAYASIIEVA